MELRSTRDGKFHITETGATAPGAASVVVFDGKHGWSNTARGYELLSEPQVAQLKDQFGMIFPFWVALNPDASFKTFKTTELTKLNEKDCYKVAVTVDGQSPFQHFGYFDVESKLLCGTGISQDGPMGTVAVNFRFGDWKEIDKLKTFSKITIDQPGQNPLDFAYTDIEVNKVDPAVFAQPDEVKELIKKQEAPPAAAPSTPPTDAPPPAPAPATPPPAPKEPGAAGKP